MKYSDLFKTGSALALAICALGLSLPTTARADLDIILNEVQYENPSPNAFFSPDLGFEDPTPIADLPAVRSIVAQLTNEGYAGFSLDDVCSFPTFFGFPVDGNNADPQGRVIDNSDLAVCAQIVAENFVTNFGENPGTTLGELRRNLTIDALNSWNALDSVVPIVAQTTWGRRECASPGSGNLGFAGVPSLAANFDNAPYPNTYYVPALANSLAGEDQTPGAPDPSWYPVSPTQNDDYINAYNGEWDLAGEGTCGFFGFYYGYDKLPWIGGQLDLYGTVEHEFGHGLGFAAWTTGGDGTIGTEFEDIPNPLLDPESGARRFPDPYTILSFSKQDGRNFAQVMSPEQRLAALTSGDQLVWFGPNANRVAPDFLEKELFLSLDNRPGFGPYEIGSGSRFGDLQIGDLIGEVVLVEDGGGNDPNDGCETITNAVALDGKIALAYFRADNPCGSTGLAANVEATPAIGLIIINDAGLGGFFGSAILPTGILDPLTGDAADGDELVSLLPGVEVSLIESDVESGLDENGTLKLFAPVELRPGSSHSHWDTTATPDLLMEPFIGTNVGVEPVAIEAMRDIGWFGDTVCPIDSEAAGADGVADETLISKKVMIGQCNTRVNNSLGPYVFPAKKAGQDERLISGCTINDMVNACITAGAGDDKMTRKCLKRLNRSLRSERVIRGRDKARIAKCINREYPRPSRDDDDDDRDERDDDDDRGDRDDDD